MQEKSDRGHPKLKDLVVEASRALARLDADRLEELALSCQALNRDLIHDLNGDPHREPKPSNLRYIDGGDRSMLIAEAKEAVGDMAVFARVLEVTRANLNVMHRLRELRAGRLEYRIPQLPEWPRTESSNGDD